MLDGRISEDIFDRKKRVRLVKRIRWAHPYANLWVLSNHDSNWTCEGGLDRQVNFCRAPKSDKMAFVNKIWWKVKLRCIFEFKLAVSLSWLSVPMWATEIHIQVFSTVDLESQGQGQVGTVNLKRLRFIVEKLVDAVHFCRFDDILLQEFYFGIERTE